MYLQNIPTCHTKRVELVLKVDESEIRVYPSKRTN